MQGLQVDQGISFYKTRHINVLELHHSADAEAHAKALLAKQQLPDAAYQREYELSRTAMGGALIFRALMAKYASDIFCDPFPIPDDWRVAYGLDWGWASESAILEGCFDDDNQILYVTWEFYEREQDLDKLAEAMITRPFYDGKNFMGVFADPSLFRISMPRTGKTKDPRGIGEALQGLGVRIYRANNSRIEGLQRLLAMWSSIEINGPTLKIFNNCENLYNELYNLRRDEKNPNDADTTMPDHAYDALRYLGSATYGLIDQRVEVSPVTLTTDEPNSVLYWWGQYQDEQRKKKGTQPIRSMRQVFDYNRQRRLGLRGLKR
jgi:hypothetical protein